MSTVLLSLTAALLFALGNQFSRLALRYTDSQTAVLYQIGVSTGLYWLCAPFFLEAWYWGASVLPLLAVLGLFRPILSANLGMAGTRILGPTIAATLSATAPLFGVALGVLILAEPLGWPVAVGTGGVVTAVVLLSWRGRAQRQWPLWALLLPIGAAVLRSVSHALAKIALETVPSPFFVALVAYSVSLPLALANDLRVRRTRAPIPPAGRFWLVSTGFAYGIAVLVLNTALLRGNLVVVSPILACSPLFTLLLGYVVFREDTLNQRVALAALLVVPSVILIATRG
jgi:drug/metabolite transporter (DMT)-like permease